MTKLIQKWLGSKDRTSEDEIFGQLVSLESSSVPANDKLFIKRKVNSFSITNASNSRVTIPIRWGMNELKTWENQTSHPRY